MWQNPAVIMWSRQYKKLKIIAVCILCSSGSCSWTVGGSWRTQWKPTQEKKLTPLRKHQTFFRFFVKAFSLFDSWQWRVSEEESGQNECYDVYQMFLAEISQGHSIFDSKIFLGWLMCCFVHWVLPYGFTGTAFKTLKLKAPFLFELQLEHC